MAIENLTIRLFYVDEIEPEKQSQSTVKSVELIINEKTAPELIKKLPPQFADECIVWLTISRTDGSILAFADGVDPHASVVPENRRGERVSAEDADALRIQAALFEKRRTEKNIIKR